MVSIQRRQHDIANALVGILRWHYENLYSASVRNTVGGYRSFCTLASLTPLPLLPPHHAHRDHARCSGAGGDFVESTAVKVPSSTIACRRLAFGTLLTLPNPLLPCSLVAFPCLSSTPRVR